MRRREPASASQLRLALEAPVRGRRRARPAPSQGLGSGRVLACAWLWALSTPLRPPSPVHALSYLRVASSDSSSAPLRPCLYAIWRTVLAEVRTRRIFLSILLDVNMDFIFYINKKKISISNATRHSHFYDRSFIITISVGKWIILLTNFHIGSCNYGKS